MRGWTDPIGVRRRWRKQGLARALIARSLRLLREQGMTEAGLGSMHRIPTARCGCMKAWAVV